MHFQKHWIFTLNINKVTKTVTQNTYKNMPYQNRGKKMIKFIFKRNILYIIVVMNEKQLNNTLINIESKPQHLH